MKIKNTFSSLVATLALGAAFYAQNSDGISVNEQHPGTGCTGGHKPSRRPAPNQIVYTPRLPSAAEANSSPPPPQGPHRRADRANRQPSRGSL